MSPGGVRGGYYLELNRLGFNYQSEKSISILKCQFLDEIFKGNFCWAFKIIKKIIKKI